MWNNDIEASYFITRARNSKMTFEEIAKKMADGISIGTTQEAQGVYTVKRPALHIHTETFNSGYLRAEVKSVIDRGIDNSAIILIAFSSQILGDIGGFPMLMSALVGDQYGTAYEVDSVKLFLVTLPREYQKQFPGPKFGVEGLREKYGTSQPIPAILLKPNTGQSPAHYAEIAKEAVLGGALYIKDDEMKVNSPEMVRAVSGSLEGMKHVLYGPNVTVQASQARAQVYMAVYNGASALMVNAVQGGLEYVRMIVEDRDLNLPIHVHRTGHDALTRGKFGLSLSMFTMLWRLAGADQIHIGPVFGGLYKPNEVLQIYESTVHFTGLTRINLIDKKASLSVISRANLDVIQGTVNYLKTKDLMFLCDDGVYKHPDGIRAGMREISDFLNKVEVGELSEDDKRDIDQNDANV